MGRTGTTRRRALVATGAVAASALASGLLAGCAGDEPDGPRGPSAAERARRAETTLRHGAAASSRALLSRYDEVLGAHPTLRSRLAPLREAVALHVKALAPPDEPEGPPSPAPEAPSAAPSTTAPPAVPAEPGAALKELAALSSRTAAAHTATLMTAPPEYARLLASVAAAGSAHAYLLTEGSRS
ncbi:hypothetical protein [Streptomyces sp. NPDC047928]|uniref:hypothetical protein n=1 Tax=unclassified Streptomyces TaxID=2593676 RepID=UPI003717FCDB